MTTAETSVLPLRVFLVATGSYPDFPLGRLAAVLGVYEVVEASYQRDEPTNTVTVRVQVRVADHAAGLRLRRRLMRCVGITDVSAPECASSEYEQILTG